MQKRHHLIATAFDKKGNVIGAGVNDYNKSHPLMKIYNLKSGDHKEKIYLHAEVKAGISAGKKKIHHVLVQRFDSNGNPALARPCITCYCFLQDYGVQYVEYTTTQGIRREYINRNNKFTKFCQ